MKKLFVLRHAHARGPASAPTDFDRGLDSRGREQAAGIARTIRDRGFDFDAIIASPALRVVETIAGFSAGAKNSVPTIYDQRVYNARPEALLDIIRDAEDTVRSLLMVGHNPGLQELLMNLAQDDPDGLRVEVASGYPTAALAELELAIDYWRDIGPGTGRILSLIRPGDADE